MSFLILTHTLTNSFGFNMNPNNVISKTYYDGKVIEKNINGIFTMCILHILWSYLATLRAHACKGKASYIIVAHKGYIKLAYMVRFSKPQSIEGKNPD